MGYIPEGWHEVKNITGVFRKGNEIVICGVPESEDEEHNCDYMGCSSVSCVLLRGSFSYMRIGYSEPK